MNTKTLIRIGCMAFTGVILSTSCMQEDYDDTALAAGNGQLRIGLQYTEYDNGQRASKMTAADYNLVKFLVAEPDGTIVDNMKGFYDKASSSICIEGLQAGDYCLLIAGVTGNWENDGVTFEDIEQASETWIRFSPDKTRTLSAEYFYSSTDFSVVAQPEADGWVLSATLPATIEQKRIVGRLDINLMYNNPYLADATLAAQAVLHSPTFYTELSGDGRLAGEANVEALHFDLHDGHQFRLLPTTPDADLKGTVDVLTRNYLGDRIQRTYAIGTAPITANRIHTVEVAALHPEDGNGTMFITQQAYRKGNHPFILQDDEHHDTYTDPTKRYFNTAQPIQLSVANDGALNVRFYSPKPVADILIRARIPSTGNEYIDLAYFDTIPAFADFHAPLPAATKGGIYRTESGRIVQLPAVDTDEWQQADFKILSEDPYWKKLQDIKHGWNIRFALYGGDPTRPDGGPNGNWMGIRPVHCREVVAFFLNFTYMIDMPEHEEILRNNEDRLYGNGGIDDKVTAETVLAQMRQNRSIRVGLVYTGNLVMGLGGGDVFGAYQGGWFEHYTSAYACEVMFHELGHVMGYSHDSSFTYGPWAQELMNNFYINNLSKMPVESPHYLNSVSNPHKY